MNYLGVGPGVLTKNIVLIYEVLETKIRILACKYHYQNNKANHGKELN